jgi:probable HAF family extracellular repeat protein
MTSFRNFAFLALLLLSVGPSRAQTPSEITTQLTFTTIDVPGAGFTGVSGINTSGEMVGDYGQNPGGSTHGFLYSNGTFTYFDYPGETVTVPGGINDSGLIVGYTGVNPVYGFLYDGTTFTTLQDGSNTATYGLGINNAGWIVGGAGDIYATKAFRMLNGHYRTVRFPGQYVYGKAAGINNLGKIVGYTLDGSYGYGYAIENGRIRNVDVPGAIMTLALGINDGGMIVGWYEKGPPYAFHGFAWMNGKYISLNFPGAVGTFASGINASGQIVGAYQLADSTYHGFITSPITPANFEQSGLLPDTSQQTGQ